jgi:hypothetical protein
MKSPAAYSCKPGLLPTVQALGAGKPTRATHGSLLAAGRTRRLNMNQGMKADVLDGAWKE